MKRIVRYSFMTGNRGLVETIDAVVSRGCRIVSLNDDESGTDLYVMEVLYFDNNDTVALADYFAASSRQITLLSTDFPLEESLTRGLLDVTANFTMETQQDYEVNLLGGYEFLQSSEEPENNEPQLITISITGGVQTIHDSTTAMQRDAERDALVIRYGTGFRAFPLIVSLDNWEDLSRLLNMFKDGASVLRVACDSFYDYSFYQRMIEESPVPLLMQQHEEMAVHLASMVESALKELKLNPGNTALGIIGLDASMVSLAKLMERRGIYRILGYDDKEDVLQELERYGGMATSPEHIYRNADILIVNTTGTDGQTFRPGQWIILTSKEWIPDLDNEKSARNVVRYNSNERDLLTPGMVRYLARGGSFSPDTLLSLSKWFAGEVATSPQFFSDIHYRMADFLAGDES